MPGIPPRRSGYRGFDGMNTGLNPGVAPGKSSRRIRMRFGYNWIWQGPPKELRAHICLLESLFYPEKCPALNDP